MSKFWNFVLFQAGWFACILGAANHQVLWPVLGSLAYLVIHIWRSEHPNFELKFMLKVLIFGVSADSLTANLGYLHFQDAWPSSYLSPLWMWILWALLATTIGSSLSWLRSKPLLGAALGAIAGPLSYEAGIRLGAGSWGVGGQFGGLVCLAIIWSIAVPLFFYWYRHPIGTSLGQNQ